MIRKFFIIIAICFVGFFKTSAEEPVLYRWKPDDGWDNFGDALSQPLVERILGRNVKTSGSQKRVFAIGSILHSAINGDTIWGSGVMTGWLPECINQDQMNLDIRAVRGPLTRDMLLSRGINCPPIYGDPALLFGVLFPEFKKNPQRKYIVIPHASETHLFRSDPNFVSPRDPWETVIQKIVESEFVIASSLHGIIVAEAYGIPARMLLATNHLQFFKYKDYYYGTGRPSFQYATSIEEALRMGGEKPPICDLDMLLNSFPYELWEQ
jgi:pyruvyltransferase